MTERELAALKARFGLPDHVIEFLRHQPRLDPLTFWTGGAVCIALIAVLASLPITTHQPDARLLLLEAGAVPRDTILLKVGVASLMTAMLGGMFLAIYLFYRGVSWLPDVHGKSIVHDLHQAVGMNGLVQSFMRWSLKGAPQDAKPKEYLNHYGRRRMAVWGRIALFFYLVTLPLLILDLRSISYVTQNGITVSPYLTGKAQSYGWGDIVRIQTGCITGKGRSKGPFLKYYLYFGDGRTANLGSYKSARMSRLDALEFIDGKLTALGVPKMTGRLEDRCLNAKRKELGPQGYERLERILNPKAS